MRLNRLIPVALTVTLGLILTAAGCSSTDAEAALPLNDAEIAHIAVTANQIDIDAARFALERAHSTEVREFAETMIRDHTAVIEQAVALVTRLGVTPSDNAVSQDLLAGASTAHEALKSVSDSDFERAYMDREVGYHEAVIAAIKTALIPSADNGDLKSFLEGVAPALEGHLVHAKRVQADLNDQ